MPFTESNYENAVLQLFTQSLGYSYAYGPDIERDYHSPLYEDELLQLYPDKRFPMALGYTRTEPKKDVIAAVGYLGSEIVGVAGANDDCETMWQVGIDVLPTFRGRGYARALVDTLTREIMRLGKVPFYCTAWSNIASKRTAISCGYRDAWVELSVKENAFTEKMIHHSEDNR